jgi:hypothetical protein
MNLSKAAVAGHSSPLLLLLLLLLLRLRLSLRPFKEGKLGAIHTSPLDGIVIGAITGVTIACEWLTRPGVAVDDDSSIIEDGRNEKDSVHDVLSPSQQQQQHTAEHDEAVESARRLFDG